MAGLAGPDLDGVHRSEVSLTINWRQNGGLIFSLTLISLEVTGVTIGSLGLFLNPIRSQFHWSSQHVSQLASAFLLASSVSPLAAGWLLDRINARWVVLAGMLLGGGGLIAASLTTDQTMILVGFAIAGCGYGASAFVPATWILGVRLPQHLGLVVGIVLTGASAGAALLPPAVGYGIESLGWRATAATAGTLVIVTCVPLALLFIPTIERPKVSEIGPSLSQSGFLTLKETLLSLPFIVILLMQILYFIGYMGWYTFFVPFLVDKGYSDHRAGEVFGVMNAISAVGLFAVGWLSGRINALSILVVFLFVNAASALILPMIGNSSGSPVPLVSFIVVWGITQGAPVQLAPVILLRAVGIRHFGTVNGVCSLAAGVAGSAGPMIMAIVYDKSGDYRISFYVASLAVLAAGAVALLIRKSGLPAHEVKT